MVELVVVFAVFVVFVVHVLYVSFVFEYSVDWPPIDESAAKPLVVEHSNVYFVPDLH